ncbi:MAG TPA: hypothetical protein VL401_04225 [Alphaproteobacteria bacterium]|jgi:hypothetical protein|nr:hypothetical protein [Alphaproteobacteria bacterium]
MWQVILSFLISTSFAQGFDSNKAYQDYQFSLETYTQSNSDFQKTRDFYLANKTLTLKEDTRKKLLAMLKARDQLESVYLTALRIKLLETHGQTDKIDSEIEWYKNHLMNYKDDDVVENLFAKSSEVGERYKTNTSKVSYEALFLISLGEEIELRQSHEAIYTQLKALVKDKDFFNRWFTDIDLVIQTLKQNEELAKTQIDKSYDDASETLNSSVASLNQLNKFLTEVNTSIKNQQ